MNNKDLTIEILERCAVRKSERRAFLRSSAALTVGGLVLAGCGGDDNDNDNGAGTPPPTSTPGPTPGPAPSATSDADILNFALNLEYLEAQFYSFATFGSGLPDNLLSGTGTRGNVSADARSPSPTRWCALMPGRFAVDERQHVPSCAVRSAGRRWRSRRWTSAPNRTAHSPMRRGLRG
jgi:hypothetical protein